MLSLPRYIFILLFLLFFCSSCDKEKERQLSIKQKINEKVGIFSSKTWVSCEQRALDRAVKLADSILLANADLWQIQTDLTDRPTIPIKPLGPNPAIKIDSSKVEPIFPINPKKKK